jgi:putative ABC transport system ATP-binding protein
MIRLENICRDFQVGDQVVHALDHVDLDIQPGEYISVMGPSGSGKSTLLNLLGLLDKPTSGNYWLNDADVSSMGDDALAEQRQQNIGFIFQFFHLIPRLNALENVELPMLLAGAPVAARRERAREVLESVGLATRLHHRPDQLSGGERQRVAIGRAIVMKPGLLLADEPTGNLDQQTAASVFEVLLESVRGAGLTALIATHNTDLAARMDRAVTLRDGRLEPARL